MPKQKKEVAPIFKSGNKKAVWDGLAPKTPGGVTKAGLVEKLDKKGRSKILFKKKQEHGINMKERNKENPNYQKYFGPNRIKKEKKEKIVKGIEHDESAQKIVSEEAGNVKKLAKQRKPRVSKEIKQEQRVQGQESGTQGQTESSLPLKVPAPKVKAPRKQKAPIVKEEPSMEISQ